MYFFDTTKKKLRINKCIDELSIPYIPVLDRILYKPVCLGQPMCNVYGFDI